MRAAACAAWACGFTASALAQPSGLTVLHGSATVHTAGAVTTVVTTNGPGTNHSALDWRSFGVPGGSTVFFSQPDAGSLSINRVLGGDPSTIAGTLGSNGQLVLVNPAGIAVAPGAVIDTAGFTASTLAMSRSDAIAGRLSFGGKGSDHDFKGKSGDGPLTIKGQVLARNGDVVLIGPDLETDSGAIAEANAGDVVLAAGRTVEVTGRGLEGIRLEVRAPDDRAVNLGTLQGDSVAIFAGQLRHSGVVQARTATASGGRVVLQATDDAEIGGSIQATALAHGGSVLLTAAKLILKSQASIDVSHINGGGEILAGGGWQGADSRVANAREVEVDPGVVLKADATLHGNGGTIVVWSQERTRYSGSIVARAAGGGVGGHVEVSGARGLEFHGKAEVMGQVVAVANGQGGSGGGSNGNSSSNDAGSGSGNDAGSGSGANSGNSNGNASGSGGGNSGNSGNTSNGGGSGGSGSNGSGNSANSGSGGGNSANSGSGNSGNGNSGTGGTVADGPTLPRRAPGHAFDTSSVTTVAIVPRAAQPEAVQAALREPVAASESFIESTTTRLDAPAAAADKAGDDRAQPKVVVSESTCSVTR